ncbi:MAG: YicC family protein [Bacteroidetes bacterium]|nr:YicC family protein [Saprospirales bacterium]RME11104.1 MAG: YicC family protein [Bacteroidota bacterium]
MTGYGRASSTYEKKTISVEVRSLNSKYTDIRLKVPSNFREREHQLRKLLTNKAERGKIEMTIEVKSMTGDDGYGLNMPLFKKYFSELSALADELGTSKEGLMQGILRIPNVVMAEDSDIDEEEWKAILNTVNEALEKFHSFRLAEGAAMEEDLRLRVNNILQALEQVNPFEKERIVLLQNRLRQNLQEFFGKENVDENRFEQEVIFYLEKIDITEEKVRLAQHCQYFLEQLDNKKTTKGRTLSFISQEMGREINTLGAKAYSADIQRLVVGMKDDLEKIKEQIANSV